MIDYSRIICRATCFPIQIHLYSLERRRSIRRFVYLGTFIQSIRIKAFLYFGGRVLSLLLSVLHIFPSPLQINVTASSVSYIAKRNWVGSCITTEHVLHMLFFIRFTIFNDGIVVLTNYSSFCFRTHISLYCLLRHHVTFSIIIDSLNNKL